MSQSKEEKKVILLVGASSGFGLLAAKNLLMLGHTVYAAARRLERMAELEKLGATLLKMDITQDEAVLSGVERLIKEQGRLDVLFANAGYGSYGMIESIPLPEIQHQYDVNVFGTARLLQATLPQMRHQRKGRIILTSSVVGHVAPAGIGWYASSKHALEALARALRQETHDLGIEVVLIEPGVVKTEFNQLASATLNQVAHQKSYQSIVQGVRHSLAKLYEKGACSEETAREMVKAATVKKPKRRYRTTRDAKIIGLLRCFLSESTIDKFLLWKIHSASKRADQ